MSDIERALVFWRDLLGLQQVGRGLIEWAHIDRLVALENTRIEWVELRVPGGVTVELMQYHRPTGAPVPPGEENDPGRSHLSLLVDDLDAVLSELRAAGVRSRTEEPVAMERGAYEGGKAAYVFDPDGIQVELIERARAGSPETTG